MIDRTYAKSEVLLAIQDVNLAYGDKLILRDVNLTVHNVVRPNMHQGQVIALLGGSGVGKTQLFRMIAGLQKPTAGGVFLPHRKTGPVEAGEVGVVFQSYPLLKHRTVWSNLKLAASKHDVKDEQITFYLDRFGMTDRKDLYPAQLSGGQRQRIAIIQQMLCSTHFILMDEPFSGLDVKMKAEVCKLINEVSLVDELNTFVITTHDIDTAVAIADTVWVLGFQNDAEGKRIPGATVVAEFDLIERGIAWQKSPEEHPNFHATVKEIESHFF